MAEAAGGAGAATKSFDAYEIIGVITPGTVVALLLMLEWPDLKALVGDKGFSIGDFGLFIIIAFVLGHLVQAIGNLLEPVLWVGTGMPTNWVRSGRQSLISAAQRQALQDRVADMEGIGDDMATMDRRRWRSITYRAYGRLKVAGATARVDAANRTYGMCRGLSAALFACLIWTLVAHPNEREQLLLLAAALAAAIFRMRRAGITYARALLVDFIDLKPGASAA